MSKKNTKKSPGYNPREAARQTLRDTMTELLGISSRFAQEAKELCREIDKEAEGLSHLPDSPIKDYLLKWLDKTKNGYIGVAHTSKTAIDKIVVDADAVATKAMTELAVHRWNDYKDTWGLVDVEMLSFLTEANFIAKERVGLAADMFSLYHSRKVTVDVALRNGWKSEAILEKLEAEFPEAAPVILPAEEEAVNV